MVGELAGYWLIFFEIVTGSHSRGNNSTQPVAINDTHLSVLLTVDLSDKPRQIIVVDFAMAGTGRNVRE